jgi:hypothetical protein
MVVKEYSTITSRINAGVHHSAKSKATLQGSPSSYSDM